MSGLLREPVFAQRLPKDILEEGDLFSPQFNEQGLIPAITIDADTAETLMFAWMNEEALKCTLRTGEAWYWSRSRGELWHKGATSGQIQEVIELRTDCDQDVVLLKVRPRSPGACHVGYNSCFFRSVHMNSDGTVKLSFEENEKIAK